MVAMGDELKSVAEKVKVLVLRMTEEVMFLLLEDRLTLALVAPCFCNQENRLAVRQEMFSFPQQMLVFAVLPALLQLLQAALLLAIAVSSYLRLDKPLKDLEGTLLS